MITASQLDRRIRIERPVPDTSLDGAGSGSWQLHAEVWAQVQGQLPSRRQADDGFPSSTGRSRVRIRWRADITSEMRIVTNGRAMQIVSEPVEIGRRQGLEFLAEEYRPAGNSA